MSSWVSSSLYLTNAPVNKSKSFSSYSELKTDLQCIQTNRTLVSLTFITVFIHQDSSSSCFVVYTVNTTPGLNTSCLWQRSAAFCFSTSESSPAVSSNSNWILARLIWRFINVRLLICLSLSFVAAIRHVNWTKYGFQYHSVINTIHPNSNRWLRLHLENEYSSSLLIDSYSQCCLMWQ